MKTITMNAARLLVLIALLCSLTYADGEQGSGGFAADSCVVTTTRSTDGEQGSGGFTEGEQGSGGRTDGEQGSGGLNGSPCEETTSSDTFLSVIYDYFDVIF